LADFQALYKDFIAEGVEIIAGSVDPLEKAQETVEKIGVEYPVAYGLDAEEVSRLTGAFYEAKRRILHAAGFLLRPDNTVEVACYSTGPVGRLAARDVLALIRFYKSRAKSCPRESGPG